MAYVYIDPANVPGEIMLQWNDGTWEHRAYWGANLITSWGVDGTNSRRFMGPLPPAGQWVRLEVPASLVGLEGRTLNGLAFSMYGGRATWDRAGKSSGTTTTSKNVALAANGAFATASSTVNANYPAFAAINGDRTGQSWGTTGGGWNEVPKAHIHKTGYASTSTEQRPSTRSTFTLCVTITRRKRLIPPSSKPSTLRRIQVRENIEL